MSYFGKLFGSAWDSTSNNSDNLDCTNSSSFMSDHFFVESWANLEKVACLCTFKFQKLMTKRFGKKFKRNFHIWRLGLWPRLVFKRLLFLYIVALVFLPRLLLFCWFCFFPIVFGLTYVFIIVLPCCYGFLCTCIFFINKFI